MALIVGVDLADIGAAFALAVEEDVRSAGAAWVVYALEVCLDEGACKQLVDADGRIVAGSGTCNLPAPVPVPVPVPASAGLPEGWDDSEGRGWSSVAARGCAKRALSLDAAAGWIVDGAGNCHSS